MSAVWTQERVLALAPDSASASAAQGLTAPRKWPLRGVSTDARALWGECQGSGKTPYQVRIDLHEPAFKCSCPSRKFPCKHGLALLLMYSRQAETLTQGEAPEWVTTWLASRDDREAKKAVRSATEQKKPAAQPEAKAKRAAQRTHKVMAGLDELDTWLHDLVAHGFAAARTSSPWEGIAARMVDAQAPGLARLVREMGSTAAAGDSAGGGWQAAVLEQVGRLHLLSRAQRRIEALPEDLRADVRAGIGWTMTKEEVLSDEGARCVRDLWLIVGCTTEQEDRLRVQRTWLWGVSTNQTALILDFAVGPVGLDGSLAVGTALDAEVVYFPSTVPERALVKQRFGEDGEPVASGAAQPLPEVLPGSESLDEAIGRYAEVLARCPWRERTILSIRNVVPAIAGSDADRIIAVDSLSRRLEISRRFRMMPHGWNLLAISGGHPVHMYAEWDGRVLLPLGVVAAGVFHDVGPRVEA